MIGEIKVSRDQLRCQSHKKAFILCVHATTLEDKQQDGIFGILLEIKTAFLTLKKCDEHPPFFIKGRPVPPPKKLLPSPGVLSPYDWFRDM